MLGENKKVYNIILEKEVKKEIDKIAKENERSSSWLINHVLKEFIKNSPSGSPNRKN
jgi:predicted transcriptional regulator